MRVVEWTLVLVSLLIKGSTGCSVAGCSGHGICDDERLTRSCYDDLMDRTARRERVRADRRGSGLRTVQTMYIQ